MKRNFLIALFAVGMLAGAVGARAADRPADPSAGEALVKAHCMRCHGTEVYGKNPLHIANLDALRHQLDNCTHASGVKWSKQQMADVIAYLNKTFYHFK
ncbi:MAG: cytochrome c [Gammaproteobacteria bacterium]